MAALATVLTLAGCTGGATPIPPPSGTSPAPSRAAPPTASPEPPASAEPSPSAPVAAAWTQIAGDGPAAREDHTWTWDPDTRAAYLFGGRDGGTSFDDLWRLDLETDEWQRIAPQNEGPAARFGHAAVWVDGIGLVVWAGQAGSTFFDDLWAFSLNTGAWTELPSTGARPAARYGSCAALGPDARLWVSHGFTADNGRFDDTWAYDFRAGSWAESTPGGDRPIIRCLHDCLWTPDGRLVLYAGQTTGIPAIGDLWARPVDGGWTEGPEPDPPARQLYGLAAAGGRAWIFGGGGADGKKLGDLWTLDLASLDWAAVTVEGDGPSARSGAAMVVDPDAGRLLLFGGLAGDGAAADTWALPLDGELGAELGRP